LIFRGMAVTDRAKALEYLQRIGYHRLNGYWYPFRERSGLLVPLDERGCKPAGKKGRRQQSPWIVSRLA